MLAELVSPKKVTPSFVQLIDIAGLIAGASEGKGLGNQFLSNIYAVNAILHVVRCFDDPSVSHVEGNTDPVRDIEIVHREIIAKDREILERIAKKVERGHGQLNHSKTKDVLERTLKTLAEGGMANRLKIGSDQDEVAVLDSWNLLSAKPVLVCCNVDESATTSESEYVSQVRAYAEANRLHAPVVVNARLEAEVMILEDDPKKRHKWFLEYGMKESGLNNVIHEAYKMLGLDVFYTVGESEVRAWSFQKGSSAKECAEHIHTDIARGLIKAEICRYEDYISAHGKSRGSKKTRFESPHYVVRSSVSRIRKFPSPSPRTDGCPQPQSKPSI
ncbi:ribosome-binding ATPase YchF-like [Schistocerca gregaria]|uniref:ribosome-binding ATPase YchF-like n=1 Tax=Schistocerca gregaria TaxID=7010 RepID=UPI00211EE83A|nr:ribosome-binding ATPase YchF-like [Schistocerca gregaria]